LSYAGRPIANGVSCTVLFYDGANLLGSGTINGTTATYLTSALAAGTHTITASWAGDATLRKAEKGIAGRD